LKIRVPSRTCSLLAIIVLAACSESAPEHPLRIELGRLSGSQAKACGWVAAGGETDAGWACAQAADAAGQAFWFAIQGRGVDSEVWDAIGRDAHGMRYHLQYDSNPYGEASLMPRYFRDTCLGAFRLRKDEGTRLECSRARIETRQMQAPAQ
jgi:hypothetical protein